jgi:ketosteroid isomerase-like protein
MARSEPDRPALAEPVSRYCWAFDERRRDLLEQCFTEDAVWEGAVSGSEDVGPITGRIEIVEWLAGFWPHQRDQRRHVLTNFLVASHSPAAAEIHAYLVLTSARGETVSLETTGCYRVQLARDEGDWRIRYMFAHFDAPSWPGTVENLSDRARHRHGLLSFETDRSDP